jgi:hypothetical protein
MTTTLISISAVHVGGYRVDLKTEDVPGSSSFLFTVGEGDIQIVKSPPEFVDDMKHRMGAAAPLMDPLPAFHRAYFGDACLGLERARSSSSKVNDR